MIDIIHYVCDVCGGPMPQDYARGKHKPGAAMLVSVARVTDVCGPCLQRGLAMDLSELVLAAWREIEAEPEPTNSAGAPPVMRARELAGPPGRISAADKRRIQARLIAFRGRRGPGCLEEVACRIPKKRITSGELRDVIIGGISLPAGDWRSIDQALDQLEAANVKDT